MILSFGSKETEKIWHGEFSKKLPGEIQSLARRKLRMIHNAYTLQDLRIPPANRLKALKGDRKGYYSIRINDQWKIIFRWQDGNCIDVQILDYHT